MNVAMRRQGGAVLPPDTPPVLEDEEAAEIETPGERRSAAPASSTRSAEPGGLLRHQIVERQLRNRRMVRQLGEDEGRLVLRARPLEGTHQRRPFSHYSTWTSFLCGKRLQTAAEPGCRVMGWRRRSIFQAAALLATAKARAGYAQQARRLPASFKILVVGAGPQNLAPQGLVQGLEEHGLIADRDYSIRYLAEGLPFGPSELQQERPDIIFAVGSRGVRMAKGATSTVPIIALDLESEPLNDNLIARFSRPGGNLTGLFLDQSAMAAKWLQYLTDTVPGLTRVAVLRQPGFADGQWNAVQAEATRKRLTLRLFEFEANTLDRVFGEVIGWAAQAFIVLSSPLVVLSRTVLADRALAARLPSITMFRVYAEAGGLLAYGPDPQTMGNRAASYVVRVRGGAMPGDLPAEQPSRFELSLNLKTARALGLSMPSWITAGADATFD